MSTNKKPVNLHFAAEALYDVERARIASEGRLRSIIREELTSQGRNPNEIKKPAGKKLTAWAAAKMPSLDIYTLHTDALLGVEHSTELVLKGALRATPFGPWVKAQKGVGEKQAARLLAAIGDPLWNDLAQRPRRGPAELWQYCGHGDPARSKRPRRGSGSKMEYSPNAKMRARMVAISAQKAGVRKLDGCDDTDGYDLEHREAITPLGAVYLKARVNKAGFIHDKPCQICAGKGKPAESAIGQPWKDGHALAHSLRLTAKEMLKDLFIEAKRLGA